MSIWNLVAVNMVTFEHNTLSCVRMGLINTIDTLLWLNKIVFSGWSLSSHLGIFWTFLCQFCVFSYQSMCLCFMSLTCYIFKGSITIFGHTLNPTRCWPPKKRSLLVIAWFHIFQFSIQIISIPFHFNWWRMYQGLSFNGSLPINYNTSSRKLI